MMPTSKEIINHCMHVFLIRMTVASGFYFLAVMVTLMLSAWQVQRGVAALDRQQVQSIKESDILQGHWLAERVLLDNRTLDGAAGYWVFAPFLTLNEQVRWVRVGFYPTQNRETIELPVLPKGKSITIEVSAIPWLTPLVWGSNIIESMGNLVWRVQQLSPQILNELSKKIWANANFEVNSEIALNSLLDFSYGYKNPGTSNPYLQPYVHFGYAFQWFGLAVASAIFFIRFMKESDEEFTGDKTK